MIHNILKSIEKIESNIHIIKKITQNKKQSIRCIKSNKMRLKKSTHFKPENYQLILIFILLLSLLIKLVLVLNIQGFQQADPGEYMDMAYQIVHENDLHSMDMRSWFLSIFLSIPIYLAKLFGINKGDFLVSLVRIIPVIFGLSSTYLIYLIGKKIGNISIGIVAAFLLSVTGIIYFLF